MLFLYKEVLEAELPWLDDVESAKASQRLPAVLTPEEVQRLLVLIEGTTGLILRLLCGTGMRIMECLRLRVKDMDFARGEILVREGKGFKDRVTMLPNTLTAPLKSHLASARRPGSDIPTKKQRKKRAQLDSFKYHSRLTLQITDHRVV